MEVVVVMMNVTIKYHYIVFSVINNNKNNNNKFSVLRANGEIILRSALNSVHYHFLPHNFKSIICCHPTILQCKLSY
jgi:hypothetical protein